ncbi:formate dehydrogenase subunit gamma [Massilia terrae]|uniref:Formate dehydrogenase subunit gamma n=1 Tax=Massilia terrae TaxID=1811224 RepID=A0ABT2CSJ0_9BURK|nr:formate dehydrogenase subunit gamma [Massilia terrae]MCS0656921.1 formate dehydrogenase subunit gamma [Massilia terrae]
MRPMDYLTRALLALMLALLLPAAWAGVPNNRAEPAYAEEQTILQAQQDSRAPEPALDNAASGKAHIDRHYIGQYGAREGDVIIQRGGNLWRTWRNGWISSTSGILIILAIIGIALFYFVIGPFARPRESGRRILRYTDFERLIHWSTAISFLLLAFTGLIIFFGKVILMPWMGHGVFSGLAFISKYIHNIFGPIFIICSLIMFFTFIHRNVFTRVDRAWLRRGGGLATHEHVPAGFFNAGEKLWFWLGLTVLGLVMTFSGLILDFTNFNQSRYVIQVANYLHLAGATFYIMAAMGHIYIGTIGTPGTYEGMRHGTVDEEWARQHHELWYEQVKSGEAPMAPPPEPPRVPPRPRPGPAT